MSQVKKLTRKLVVYQKDTFQVNLSLFLIKFKFESRKICLSGALVYWLTLLRNFIPIQIVLVMCRKLVAVTTSGIGLSWKKDWTFSVGHSFHKKQFIIFIIIVIIIVIIIGLDFSFGCIQLKGSNMHMQ